MRPHEDYYGWTVETIEKLRRGRLSGIDLEDLIEELEDMGRSERRALESRLAVLLGHLLKWRYQPDRRSYSWQGTIRLQRRKLHRLLANNPSLRPQLTAYGQEAYLDGVDLAITETDLPAGTFPATFEATGWTWEQVLEPAFYPD